MNAITVDEARRRIEAGARPAFVHASDPDIWITRDPDEPWVASSDAAADAVRGSAKFHPARIVRVPAEDASRGRVEILGRPIIVVGPPSHAPLVLRMLEQQGFEDVSVLAGGEEAWRGLCANASEPDEVYPTAW